MNNIYNKYNRPICSTPGCKNACQIMRTNKQTGYIIWRKICSRCHNTKTAAKHGLNNISEITAKKAGFESVADYKNSMHPYRNKRKNYCENIDGRLGFKCTYPSDLPLINGAPFKGYLQVDHINGDPTDNREENLQTLCACCHSYKTILNKDSSTPGRKGLKNSAMYDKFFFRPNMLNVLVDNHLLSSSKIDTIL